MKNNYFLKISVSLLLTIFVSIGLFTGVGRGKQPPQGINKISKEKFYLPDYLRGPGSYTYVAHESNGGWVRTGELIVTVEVNGSGRLLGWDRFYLEVPGDPPVPAKSDLLNIRYELTPSGWFELGRDRVNWNGQISNSEHDPPILVFPFITASVGDHWGGAFIEEVTIDTVPFYHARMWTYTILGTETVTVNGITYADCLKIARYRASMGDSVKWYAKGIGQVKMIYPNATGGGGQLFELLTYTSTP